LEDNVIEQILYIFKSFFTDVTFQGIGLALAFGAVWIAAYWPPLIKKPWMWAILVSSAFLTLVAIAFIQTPLQVWSGRLLNYYISGNTSELWLLLSKVPGVLFIGLVQEGAKLVPVVIYWWRKGRNIDPKLGLMVGAIAGAGYGIFEAQLVHNAIFSSGWSWDFVTANGIMALAPFWEKFFTVGFHTAISAFAGYGLASGRGWQFYLIASAIHAYLNSSAILAQAWQSSFFRVEIFIAVVSLAIIGWALWMRWWKKPTTGEESAVG
jgi:RsiW-degrading membrane proteinase PrsW (M82 family)